MTEPTPQAITAAAAVLHDEYCADGDTQTCGRWNSKVPGGYDPQKHIGFYEDLTREILKAALPHLEAFPHCPTACDDDCEQPCHEVHQIPRKQDHHPDTCVGTITAAVADDARRGERERYAQLAGGLKFTLYRPAANGPGGDHEALDVVPLGELLSALREAQ